MSYLAAVKQLDPLFHLHTGKRPPIHNKSAPNLERLLSCCKATRLPLFVERVWSLQWRVAGPKNIVRSRTWLSYKFQVGQMVIALPHP